MLDKCLQFTYPLSNFQGEWSVSSMQLRSSLRSDYYEAVPRIGGSQSRKKDPVC